MWQGGKLTCQPAISLCYRLMAAGHGLGSLVYVQPSTGTAICCHTKNTKLSQMVPKATTLLLQRLSDIHSKVIERCTCFYMLRLKTSSLHSPRDAALLITQLRHNNPNLA